MVFETLADVWPPSLSILIFGRYIGIDLSGYPSDSSGHQTLRRRPPQRAKKKLKLSGKSLEWPKVKQTCLTPCQPSLPCCEHSGFSLGWDGLYTMHEVPSRTETKACLPQKKLTGRLLWLKKVQENFKGDERFEEQRLQLNLQENESGLECTGRIQGVYPIYVPDSHQFALKLVEEEHKTTLHGGVGLTMAKIRVQYWIPRLRRLARKVIKSCNGRKRFHFTAFTSPAPGQLPRDRTEGQNAFQVIGVDQSSNN